MVSFVCVKVCLDAVEGFSRVFGRRVRFGLAKIERVVDTVEVG